MKHKKTAKLYLLLTVMFSLLFQGCTSYVENQSNLSENISQENIIDTPVSYDGQDLKEPEVWQQPSEDNLDEAAQSDAEIAEKVELDAIPDFSGKPYVVVNDNTPEFSDTDKNVTAAFEIYSDLDSLGRCGVAYANICEEIMPIDERGEIGQIKPSGWHTIKYDIVDGNYLYNRCHLIGYQLAGENDNEKNLITGTRYLNMEGMLPFENLVTDYVKSTGNHVLYRVTPIYEGDNLLANAVQMEGYSVEDNGAGICFNIYVYNNQPGISIDYATGDSWLLKDADVKVENNDLKAGVGDLSAAEAEISTESNAQSYILNTNTKKFHYPSCDSVNDMKEDNKKEFTSNRDDLINQGYSPCQRCRP